MMMTMKMNVADFPAAIFSYLMIVTKHWCMQIQKHEITVLDDENCGDEWEEDDIQEDNYDDDEECDTKGLREAPL